MGMCPLCSIWCQMGRLEGQDWKHLKAHLLTCPGLGLFESSNPWGHNSRLSSSLVLWLQGSLLMVSLLWWLQPDSLHISFRSPCSISEREERRVEAKWHLWPSLWRNTALLSWLRPLQQNTINSVAQKTSTYFSQFWRLGRLRSGCQHGQVLLTALSLAPLYPQVANKEKKFWPHLLFL